MNTTTEEDINKGKFGQRALLLFILLFPVSVYLFFSTGKENFISLPYYGPREPVTTEVEGEKVVDTIYHSIPPFSFINQNGRIITNKDLNGKIYVADYFFATCEGICPKMTSNMSRVQQKFKGNNFLAFISHTVDPERDSVEALREYAIKVHADTTNWHFVTGEKKALYDLARQGYFITAIDGDGGAEDFIHSEKLVLVDKQGHIRGFYDGSTVSSVDSLIDDIRVLQADYARREHDAKTKLTTGKPK